MKKTLLILLLCFYSYSSYCDSPKIHSDLLQKMNETNDNSSIPIYIIFNEHLTLNDFSDISYETPRQERREIVIERLKTYADNYQKNVRDFLELKKSRAEIENYEVLWLTNSIVTSAPAEVIYEIADFENIKMICYNKSYPDGQLLDSKQINAPFIEAMVKTNVSVAPEPGVLLMRANQVWALGNTGTGVLVANSDDGFWWKHPDLVRGVWQNLGEDINHNGRTVDIQSGTGSVFDAGDVNGIDDDANGKIDDLIGWDFTTNNYNITSAAHGSATLGHVVGDGTMGTQTGVAPGAKSILMRNNSGEAQQILAFQYAVLMGSDVITSSLSWKWYFSPKPDYSLMRLATDMSLAAGVVHTNSTSNDGNNQGSAPIPLNISTSGNCPPPWLHPEQLRRGNVSGVIGIGNVDCLSDIISSSSPHGPATWGNWNLWGTYTYPIDPAHKDYPYSYSAPVEIPDSMGLLKPDVSAPGNSSISTYVSSGSGYSGFSGTSSATPHAAGCVALMLSINPEMLPQDVDKVLELTSVEKGVPGKDPRYGTGRIDAVAATTSPKFTVEGIQGGSNMLINTTLIPNDTARELVGLKISTDLNPKVGSLKSITFTVITNTNPSHITSFDLFWDKDRSNLVSSGDIKLKSHPYTIGNMTFDSLKFKFLDTARTIILSANTTSNVSGHYVELLLLDTSKVIAYYTTKPFQTNFPFGTPLGISQTELGEMSYSLSQNYPNPFNPATMINYTIARDGLVKLRVYDMIGKEVATLINGFKARGNYIVEFDFKDHSNLSSGVYYYKIESNEFTGIKKMILLK
ncbi:MAG: S8 family peptidase [Bacteroidota bacterium]|nr:S8 family peptidase [Bacteroidota bacterium]